MDHVESASYDLVTTGGYVCDPEGLVGSSLILAELVGRGAGPFNSRQLSEAFDDSGIRHGEGVGADRMGFSGSLVADKLPRALELVAHMVQRPHLPEEEIEAIQSVLLQDLSSLSDNPARRAMIELSHRYYPAPYNRSSLGDAQGIVGTDIAALRALQQHYCSPQGAILSIAGKVNAQQVLTDVERLFSEWSGAPLELPRFGEISAPGYHHVEFDSAQMQVVMALPSVKFAEEFYYSGKIAVSILGASMFGRLFMELREKRGLCYSVYARHGANTHYGTVSAYVGTTPERAQESLDMLLSEFGRLAGTVTDDEVQRAKTNLKSALVMGEESPASRASSNGSDWWLIKRIRPLQEINAAIDAVSVDSVNSFLKTYPFRSATILTLGRAPLVIPAGLFGEGA
jgi:predicted Zn-dependent peptidase